MFTKLKELVESLDNGTDFKNYKNGVIARETLQKIKNEAQLLRNKIVDLRKGVIEHKVTKEEIEENNLEGQVEEGENVGIPVEEEIEEPTVEEETFDNDGF